MSEAQLLATFIARREATQQVGDRDGDRVTIDAEITIKGHTETAEITGEISDPIADLVAS
jgi:hypothetical protein